MPARVLIVGLGDLARRIAQRLAAQPEVGEIVLAARNARAARTFAALLEASEARRVYVDELDALDEHACAVVLQTRRPDLVVQCAATVSPWAVAAVTRPAARPVIEAGFAIQLPFQLLCVSAVMRAVRAAGFAGPVVNCSYPDATHPVLAAADLAPTVGIGNVGMMQTWVQALLRREPGPVPLVRMVAHHGQTASVLTAAPVDGARPWVYLGDEGQRRDELAYGGVAIDWGIETNALTAAVAVLVIRALLPGGEPVRASVPGPLGLPGGYPVLLSPSGVALDLPPGLSREDAEAQNQRAGRLDGIAGITEGLVEWTPDAARRLEALHPDLAEPLTAAAVPVRAALLAEKLELGSRRSREHFHGSA